MSDYLCLRFTGTEIHAHAVVSWSVLSSTAQIIVSGETLLSRLPQDIADKLPESEQIGRTVVIMPAYAALMTEAELPAKQQRHLKQVLPFLVEEHMIDPVESMHLATPVLHEGNRIPVAGIARHTLASWLDQLEEAHISPDYLFLDACCLPDRIGNRQILLDGPRVLLRSDRYQGMSFDYEMTESTLKLVLLTLQNRAEQGAGAGDSEELLAPSADEQATSRAEIEELINVIAADESDLAVLEQLQREASELAGLYGEQATDANAPRSDALELDQFEDVESELLAESTRPAIADRMDKIDRLIRSENINTERTHYSETVAELLAVSAVQSVDLHLNLLQGDFRPANANAQNRRIMRRVAGTIAASLAFFLVVTLGGGFYLNWRADGYFDKSVAIYREVFPKQRRVLDPVKQMKRQLSGQAIGATTSEFLPLLDAASRSLVTLEQQSSVEASIKQLRYDVQRGNIAMDIQANNIDELEAYKDLLAAEGLSVDILSANQDGEIVKGRLQIGRS